MTPITTIPNKTYYLAYLSSAHTRDTRFDDHGEIILCRAPEQPYIYSVYTKELYDLQQPNKLYGFGSNWELFELNDDEIINHIIPEII